MNKLVTLAIQYIGTNPGNWIFPWCASFLNKLLNEAGHHGTNSRMARSFLKIGEHTDKPVMGDIVVLWRVFMNSPWGHCGLYIAENETYIYILGGNQNLKVSIKRYRKRQLLEIRKINV